MHLRFVSGNLEGRNYLIDLGIDERITLDCC
jgi:hypothetical protein